MELNKDELRRNFSKDFRRYYSVETFKNEGFERKQCVACKKFFWTLDSNRGLCGDPSHEPYSFIKKRQRDVEYGELWNVFSSFFKSRGHAVIGKYPVVSRWRKDLYYTIASIQDFQRIENGRMAFEYPANPLIVPQICLRFNDISNVGITGRHMTSFMMAGQHSFDYPRQGYWKDETIELNFDFLVNKLGVGRQDLTYVEDVWAMGDFSEFGPCLESFSNGLELVNSVFTEFEFDGQVKEIGSKVVDVGWGFERLMWFHSGAQTAYDTVFRKQLEYIHNQLGIRPDQSLYAKIAGISGNIDLSEGDGRQLKELTGIIDKKDYDEIIKPMQASYIISDHLRTLLFAIADGALPSNIGGGYNLRVLLRRVFDIDADYGAGIDLMKVMELHARELREVYKDIGQDLDEISRIFEIEKERYANTKKASVKIINALIDKKESITPRKLKTLYESHGITPSFIQAIAKEKNIGLEIDDSYMELLKNDFVEKQERKQGIGMDTEGIPKTEKLYYEFRSVAEAEVLRVNKNLVALDRTVFYPEGGGQESDIGTIGGIAVKGAQAVGGVVIHELERAPEFKKGERVSCIVDQDRRSRLMAHHTATHLISNACREILGKHAWQEGSLKTYSKAHIDVSHYQKITGDEIRRIEKTVNDRITKGIKVGMEELERKEAEKRFGFAIYQGHGVPSKKLRIIEIKDLDGNVIDAEACGGLHLIGRESGIGLVKVIRVLKIHDGVNRIEFVAGLATLDYFNNMQAQAQDTAKAINSDFDKVYSKAVQQFNEVKECRKDIEAVSNDLAEYMSDDLLSRAKEGDILIKKLDCSRKTLRDITIKIAERNPEILALSYNSNFEIVCIAGRNSKKSAIEFVRENSVGILENSVFAGGGSDRICEGVLKRDST
ncbi:MAG: alanine--tRNA ligase [Candidatus Marsarchaeota archaeon]|nr:alanine--tRNA ligase [Candidatus Marsarchaeota archaeon]MCL5106310.1 alanine--tRNA ligase [Candidatus Marsarchaeota archaeon]